MADFETTLFFGADNIQASTANRFMPMGYDDFAPPDTDLDYLMTIAGNASNLRVRIGVADGNGEPVVYTVQKNGNDTSLSVSIDSNVDSGENLVDSVDYDVGDRMSLKISKAADIGSSMDEITASLLFLQA